MANTERTRKAAKRTIIAISSSSSSSASSSSGGEESSAESEDYDISSESESKDYDISSESEDYDVSSDDGVEEVTSSTSCGDDDEEEDDDDSVDKQNRGKDEESMWSRVVNLLKGKSDLQELTLEECKAYLRKDGLRLSGTRAECIERIKEHSRLQGGIGEALYPRSSFTIDCTGDVCKGDVVLFTQKVYKKFDKVTRSGSLLGKRIIAGRIVKESYGAVKQQHTFTVEVLWSKGVKHLPPLFPLLVKGRNLYRMRTYRQRWRNEKERTKVLAEKHRRGAAARLIREMRRTKAVKTTRNISSAKEGSKRQKRSHQHSSSAQTNTVRKDKNADKYRKIPVGNRKCNYCNQKLPLFGQSNLKGTRKLIPCSPHQHHKNWLHPNEDQELSKCDYPQHHGRPTHEWRNSNYLSGMRTNSSSQPFSCKADSSRRRR